MTATRTAAKPARSLSWNAEGKFFLIQQGRSTAGYWLAELNRCDMQGAERCFRLTKFARDIKPGEPTNYDVVISPDGFDSCECLGHLRHGHKTVCRHVAAVRCLIAKGKIA